MNPSVSIVVPVYNAEKHLPFCIESIKRQTCDDYEVILINDGSNDGSDIICMKYASEDSRVNYIEKTNGGVSAARNLGFKIAQGKYVALLDNDDYLNCKFVEYIVQNISDNPDVVIFGYKQFDDRRKTEELIEHNDKEPIVFELKNSEDYLQKEMFCPTDSNLTGLSIVFPWAKAYNKSFLICNHLEFDSRIKLCEDVYLNLEIYNKAKYIKAIRYTAYFYYKNIESAGKGYNPSVVNYEINNIRLLDEYVMSKPRDKEYLKAYSNCLCFRYWSCCFSYFVHPDNKKSIQNIVSEMKAFEKATNIRRAFRELVKIRKSMEIKEWIFLMAIKYHFYYLILCIARKKMKMSRAEKSTI